MKESHILWMCDSFAFMMMAYLFWSFRFSYSNTNTKKVRPGKILRAVSKRRYISSVRQNPKCHIGIGTGLGR